MRAVILSNDLQKEELTKAGLTEGVEIIWATDFHEFKDYKNADAFIDLLFENLPERLQVLKQLLPTAIVINSVTDTLGEVNTNFIRIAGWPTFLQGSTIEASCLKDDLKEMAQKIFSVFNKHLKWLPDEPGFVTPRVISTIINEAYFALEDGVSTPEEIDIAMKLGTAYPYGPFAWSREIGLQNIANLLLKLSKQHQRYTPSELLVQETNKSI